MGANLPTALQGKLNSSSLTFVTGNAKKLEEVRAILAAQAASAGKDLPYSVCNKKIDLPELQGEPVEVAKEKCRLAALQVRRLANIRHYSNICWPSFVVLIL